MTSLSITKTVISGTLSKSPAVQTFCLGGAANEKAAGFKGEELKQLPIFRWMKTQYQVNTDYSELLIKQSYSSKAQ